MGHPVEFGFQSTDCSGTQKHNCKPELSGRTLEFIFILNKNIIPTPQKTLSLNYEDQQVEAAYGSNILQHMVLVVTTDFKGLRMVKTIYV